MPPPSGPNGALGARGTLWVRNADAPERLEALRAMVTDIRPSAEIEVSGMLGPVVGTHAGPGTVGFFWWDSA